MLQVTASADNTLKLWDVNCLCKELSTLRGHQGTIKSVDVHRDEPSKMSVCTCVCMCMIMRVCVYVKAVCHHTKFVYHDTIVMVSWYALGIDALHDMAEYGLYNITYL